ncbi:MAG: hypothetical protein Kow0029_29070 [Candidatus Rifleibacteriota bacterium]
MDEITRELLRELQIGFKLETRPFKRIANKLGLTEEQVLEKIKENLHSGVIRRIGAAVRPEKMGHSSNALVVWQVDSDKIAEIGEEVSKMREVSHCYERETREDWPFNFYTMIHAKEDSELQELIARIAEKHTISNYRVFRTVKELKKTSMKYFKEDTD